MMTLKILSADKTERASASAGNCVELFMADTYCDGDTIVLETGRTNSYCVVTLEDSLAPTFVYVPTGTMTFAIPPQDNRTNFSPKSFTGDRQYVCARFATLTEIAARKNLALNVYDGHENDSFYPHAKANVETRGEAVFAARNAIDGMFANHCHGKYPYQSWGINRDPEAALTIDFGREVMVDEVRLTLRADFPHDNYWTSATIHFNDGSEEVLAPLTNSDKPQVFAIGARKVTSCVLDTLIMAEGESPFPALTQIEVFGTEV